MNTKPIYILLSLVAVAAVAASVEITYGPILSSSKKAAPSTSPREHILSIEASPDFSERMGEMQEFREDFKIFSDGLFKFYRESSGENLKVLGEAVSYAGEMETILEALPTIFILSETGKDLNQSSLITRNWLDRTESSLDMHLYFIRRLENNPGIDPDAVNYLNTLGKHIIYFQGLLTRMNESLSRQSVQNRQHASETAHGTL